MLRPLLKQLYTVRRELAQCHACLARLENLPTEGIRIAAEYVLKVQARVFWHKEVGRIPSPES